VWRETWLVETNHDLCYARSDDGGKTWKRSDGTVYQLPITEATAEIAWSIPQNSELINQTSMTADAKGHPFIATYWRDHDSKVPQYRLVWHDGKKWDMTTVGDRTEPFSLSGGGTKMIPIARPRIVSDGKKACYIFRDQERGSKVSVAYTPGLGKKDWIVTDLTDFSVDAWEPSYDVNLWNKKRKLNVFVQTSHQGDGEKIAETQETVSPVYVLEIDNL
ncbi:MAG: BNR repeat-containing protein, partial [Muribaculaceae bacterium]|nr:BNR repeat-containing protein [Muribaculaceae bacterium]